jgi:hypothetical protein
MSNYESLAGIVRIERELQCRSLEQKTARLTKRIDKEHRSIDGYWSTESESVVRSYTKNYYYFKLT